MKVLNNAEKEVYLATRYHDSHVSNMVFRRFGKGIAVHILDGNPEQISVENRLAAIIRIPPPFFLRIEVHDKPPYSSTQLHLAMT
jgi:hypothetical protein